MVFLVFVDGYEEREKMDNSNEYDHNMMSRKDL